MDSAWLLAAWTDAEEGGAGGQAGVVTGPSLASSDSIFTLGLPASHSQALLLGMVGWAPVYNLDSAAHP